MLRLPFLLNFRTGAGVEIIAARVAGGQSFVPMQNYAHQLGYCVVGRAHNGQDVLMPGTLSQST